MSTLTVYPDAGDPGSATCDGIAYKDYGSLGTGQSWATLIAAAGSGAGSSGTTIDVQIQSDEVSANWMRLYRSIFLFDTSALGVSATISAATLSLWGRGKNDPLSIAPNIDIYTSSPASNTTIVAADYNALGNTSQTGSPITFANWSVTGYNDFALNATGISNISKTGISKFGARNQNYDVAASAPTWSTNALTYIGIFSADQASTTNDPKLVITYTLAPTSGFFAMM